MGIIEFIITVLVVMWLVGFALHIAGGFIHILIIIAIAVFIIRFFTRKG